jgi:hypothetical protein
MTAYPSLEIYIDGHWKRRHGRAAILYGDENVSHKMTQA